MELTLIVIVFFLIIVGAFWESLARTRDWQRNPPPGRLIDVGGHKLHINCAGERREGQPVVVLEAGMASWSFYWRLVQPEVAEFARVCAYDRAGLGWSEQSSRPRTPQQIASELHNLLIQAGEPGPYVLAGHSLGGVFVRQFARQYPQEVVGMVLVDSAHENQTEKIPGARAETARLLNSFRVFPFLIRIGIGRLLFGALLKGFPSVQTHEERETMRTILLGSAYFQTTCAEAIPMLNPTEKNPPSLDDKPLIVIRAGLTPDNLPRGYSEEKWAQVRQALDDIQEELVGLSTNSRLTVARYSLHAVQLEEPEIVIDAIHQVMEAATNHTVLKLAG